MSTEARNPRSIGLDKMSAKEIVRLMNEEEHAVLRALQSAEDLIAEAAEKAAEAYQRGGHIVYVGAGTSGRIATMDAAEMPATFGVAKEQFVAALAGGERSQASSSENAEDDKHEAIQAMNDLKVGPNDIVIGLAASGRTPFVLSAVKHARQKGVWTCGIANNAGSPLLEAVDLPILLDTGPEVLTGSTRLKAGTSQKLVLNRISTAAMVLSGKVIENLMVDVEATNQKLKERCVRIVRDLSTVSDQQARRLLDQHSWDVRKVLEIVREPSTTV